MTSTEIVQFATRKLLGRHGTKVAAAKALGVDESYIHHLLAGRRLPSVEVLEKLGIRLVFRPRRTPTVDGARSG